MIRFPLPYRVGEFFRRGNADEKLRCEAGTYTWLQENFPSIPIPYLHGFGLSTGQTFTALDNLPFIARYWNHLCRSVLGWLGCLIPSQYVRHQLHPKGIEDLGTGYLLVDYIEETQGTMLSNTWKEKCHETRLRKNLFRDLSRILLTVAQVHLPRIGSFIIDDKGILLLSNRPLTLDIHDLENEEIPVDIPRHLTYTCVDTYVADILAFHDSRLRHQPNAADNKEDCVYQLSALATMKTVSSLFLRREIRNGPFIFTFGDLHGSNIFVDENWNIKCLIDHEWACSGPIEMIHPPYWLTNQAIDGIDADKYDTIRCEFMDVLGDVEQECSAVDGGITRLSKIMERGWEMGTFWYYQALSSPSGLFQIFYHHIQPKLGIGDEDGVAFCKTMMHCWTLNLWDFVDEKTKDKQDYDLRLREAFQVDKRENGPAFEAASNGILRDEYRFLSPQVRWDIQIRQSWL